MYYAAGNIRIGILWMLIGIFIGEYPTHQTPVISYCKCKLSWTDIHNACVWISQYSRLQWAGV